MSRLSPVVEAIGELHFEGNIIPHSWYQHPLLRSDAKKRPKPHNVAIHLLADTIYWYRPMIIRDETTGRVIERRQRFEAHRWRIDYQQWANHFGYGKRQVQDASAFLKKRGIITVEVTDYTTPSGYMIHNAVFLEPVVAVIEELNRIPQVGEATKKRDPAKKRDIPKKRDNTPVKTDVPKISDISPEKTGDAPPNFGAPETPRYPLLNNEIRAPKQRVSRTEIPVENTPRLQQQMLLTDVVDDESLLIEAMVKVGVTRLTAQQLAAAAPAECQRQLDYLNHRKGRTSLAATLVKAVREEWAAPDSWQAAQQAAQVAEQRELALREETQRRDQERRREAQEREVVERANDLLDRMWESLDAAKRDRIDNEARGRLGILGRAGTSQGALQAMRRTLLRERLNQLADEE